MTYLYEFIKTYAEKHYNEGGWDFVVECWDDEQIADYLAEQGATTEAEAIAAFQPYLATMDDYRQDAINSAF